VLLLPGPTAVTPGARLVWLGVGISPYLGLVGVDTWMHECARKVGRVEKWLHAALALAFTGFLSCVFADRFVPAAVFLLAFLACLGCDELGFHSDLARSERRVHFLSYAALFAFIGIWSWTLVSP